MNIFIDTNILLRLADETSNQHELVSRAIAAILTRGDELCFAPQSIVEFWAVASRTREANGLGFALSTVEERVQEFIEDYVLLEENNEVFPNWLALTISASND